jgi:hypothetical protein
MASSLQHIAYQQHSTAFILELPNETVTQILKYLKTEDLCHCRLVNKRLGGIATPLRFRAMQTVLSKESIDNLSMIASQSHLSGLVKTWVYSTRPPPHRLLDFRDFDTWEQCVSLPDGQEHVDDSLMTREDWSHMSSDAKRKLYEEYNASYTADNSFHAHTEYIKTLPFLTTRLWTVLLRFHRITQFIHHPGPKRWVRWQCLRFDPSLEGDVSWEVLYENTDAKAMQLSYALCALVNALPRNQNLESVTLHIEGLAFWSPSRLRRLRINGDHDSIRPAILGYDDAERAEREAHEPEADLKIYEVILAKMDRIFEGLTHLDYSVSEESNTKGLYLISKPLCDQLCRSSKLKRLRLAFGDLYDYDDDHEPRGKGSGLLALLTSRRLWPSIEELHLEITTDVPNFLQFLHSLAPTLTRLTLANTTLVPQVVSREVPINSTLFDSVPSEIWRSLPELKELELSSLRYYEYKADPRYPRWKTLQKTPLIGSLLQRKESHGFV